MKYNTEKVNRYGSGFGRALRKLRESRGYNQKVFAELLGKEQNTVARWENGRAGVPKSDTIASFVKVLNLNELEENSLTNSFESEIVRKKDRTEMQLSIPLKEYPSTKALDVINALLPKLDDKDLYMVAGAIRGIYLDENPTSQEEVEKIIKEVIADKNQIAILITDDQFKRYGENNLELVDLLVKDLPIGVKEAHYHDVIVGETDPFKLIETITESIKRQNIENEKNMLDSNKIKEMYNTTKIHFLDLTSDDQTDDKNTTLYKINLTEKEIANIKDNIKHYILLIYDVTCK